MAHAGMTSYFDRWYADMARTPVKDEIMQRHLGPRHLMTTSAITWQGITELATSLRPVPGDTMLDLACGRCRIGLDICARTGCRLIGVDCSAEAVRRAQKAARKLHRRADFRIGDLVGSVPVWRRPASGSTA